MKENRYIKVKADCTLPKAYIFNTEENLIHYKEFILCGETYNFTVPDSIISLNENSIGNLPATNTLDVKLYNQIGDLIIPSSYTFSGGVFSMVIDPEIVPCLPSPISIDGIYIDDLPNTDPLDIKVVDQNDNPITPISGTVSGGVATVKIDIPVCPPNTKQWTLQFLTGNADITAVANAGNIATFASGSGAGIGTLTISTDGITYGAISYPFTPISGTTYYFKRSTTAGFAEYKMIE